VKRCEPFLPRSGMHRMIENPMDLLAMEFEQSAIMLKALPQLVPGSACFHCDVCCRFPEADSFLRPYFTKQEIDGAVVHGLVPDSFPDRSGSQIDLVRNPLGEGYLCPGFDPKSGRCGIYEARPLDCRLYPLALMWDAAQEEVVLGWDAKCPFMRETIPDTIAEHAERVAGLLTAEAAIETIASNPRLIGRFQDDVVIVKCLPQLTSRLRIDPRLHALTSADAPRFAQALERALVLAPDALAAYAFPYHAVWTPQLPHWWMESRETFFLFARSPDGWFMPLPPLGAIPLEEAVREAFTLMRRWNGLSPVNRIENVMSPQQRLLEQRGFRCRQKDGDYLYKAEALATLAGDHYKSQRALCNRIEREQVILMEPYRDGHRAGCLALHERWAAQKQADGLNSMGALLLEDAKAAHGRVLADYDRIGLAGTVVTAHGNIVAYTFGYWLTPHTWCVLLEVADRSMPGLAQWLFRETCRIAISGGATHINAMDDGGLPGLREAKRAYHPARVIENWIITDFGK
jgi:Fe-S-cluster containining protein